MPELQVSQALEPVSELRWLFLDLNSYFASVEQQENPALRGKPVAVVPMMADSTCAIAASYEAKAYGVKTGTPVYEAKKMCPGLKLVLARHDVYVDYHHRIFEEVIKHTPINKVCSIDELSSRLPPGKRNSEKAAMVAERIKEGLRKNVGEAMKCSIGVASNSLLAKIAADMNKPDGYTELPLDTLREKLCTLKLRDLPGIGHNMEARLKRAGVHDIQSLWNISPKHARKIWGGVQGERFWMWLRGYDFEAPETNRSMIGHSRVLDPALRNSENARLMARRLLIKASYRLRRQGFHAACLTLSARTVEGHRWSRDLRLPPARDPFTFLERLDDLWAEMMKVMPRDAKFLKVATLLSDLRTSADMTGDMFNSGLKENARALEKREALAAALDKLQNKYQKETVWLGVTPKTLAGHVGTKIAFARVPDREEFWG